MEGEDIFIKPMRYRLLAFVPLIVALSLHAKDPVVGQWKTIDDETGVTKSIVRLYLNDSGQLEGLVEKILHSDRGPNPLCDDCPGARRGKPIQGMVILWGLEQQNNGLWKGGHILDPKNGRVYKARLRLRQDGMLEVRGFIGFSLLGRTQVWQPLKQDAS